MAVAALLLRLLLPACVGMPAGRVAAARAAARARRAASAAASAADPDGEAPLPSGECCFLCEQVRDAVPRRRRALRRGAAADLEPQLVEAQLF